jgi:hypothetical protein
MAPESGAGGAFEPRRPRRSAERRRGVGARLVEESQREVAELLAAQLHQHAAVAALVGGEVADLGGAGGGGGGEAKGSRGGPGEGSPAPERAGAAASPPAARPAAADEAIRRAAAVRARPRASRACAPTDLAGRPPAPRPH